MTITILCEKHSQAASIAGAMKLGGMSGTWKGQRINITWASGHLLEMEAPDSATPKANWYDPASLLPLPKTVAMQPKEGAGKRLASIKSALAKADTVWVATDPDREGEAIGRELLAHFRYAGSNKRLWLAGGMDSTSIVKALGKLWDGDASLGLWRAQQARSQADYGFMYLTRAATAVARAGGMGETLGSGKGRASVASVGRVQAPTLRLIYDREKTVANFKPITHYTPRVHVTQKQVQSELIYSPVVTEAMTQTSWPGVEWQSREKGLDKPLFIDGGRAEQFRQQLSAFDVLEVGCKRARKRKPAPLCLALIDLQRLLSRKHRISASDVLAAAQKLYNNGHISYPRTEHRELPVSAWEDAPAILSRLSGVYAPARQAQELQDAPDAQRPRAYRNKAMEHHGLMPTEKVPSVEHLPLEQRAAYEAIATRYIEAHLPDAVVEKTQAVSMLDVAGLFSEKPARFAAVGERIIEAGWMAAFNQPKAPPANSPVHLDSGSASINQVTLDKAQTKPPSLFTEDTLLAAMKNAARFVEGKDASVMRDANGLGTPATRATIIETLLAREYIAREKTALRIRAKGVDLIQHLPAGLTDIAMTAQWEAELSAIETVDDGLARVHRDQFITAQNEHITAMIEQVAQAMPVADQRRQSQHDGKPTQKMLALARKIAKQKGKRLTKKQTESFQGCRQWLDKYLGDSQGGAGKPTDKMVSYAESLATRNNVALPEGLRTNFDVCKAFLNRHAGGR